MGDLFLKLLNISINAGWLIITILCFRFVFRNIPRRIHCFLWGAVAIRLICPFSMESPFSILPSAEPITFSVTAEGGAQNYIPSIDSHLPAVENTINPMLKKAFAYNESESAAPIQIVTYTAGIIWICGMILWILYAAVSTIRLHTLVKESVCIKDRIYICDAVTSSFIFGIVRPRIYLSSSLNEKEMHYILAHESMHLQRKDHWWKALGYLLLCIYWFQPLCLAAYLFFCKDIELACDEKVTKNLTLAEKKEYAKILLSHTRQRRTVMAFPLSFGETGVKERIKLVLNCQKPALWITAAAIAVCVITAICFLTNPKDESLSKSTVSTESMQSSEQQPTETKEKENAKNTTADHSTLPETILYEQPEADKVCILVQPSMIRERLSYYYIPGEEAQTYLTEEINKLDLAGKPWERRWEGHKEAGWEIIYDDMQITGFEGGYLYYTFYNDNTEEMECFIEAPKLYNYIQTLLTEELGYQNYDISNIKDIVSAKLDVNCLFTDFQFYSQTITDTKILQKFEAWFCNAEYIYGGADCGNERSCLELTLANGDTVKLCMAADSCTNFTLDGVAYNYRPKSEYWDNREFYQYFNEIPWNADP